MCQKTIINSLFLLIQSKQIVKNNLDEIFLSKSVYFFIIIYDFHVFYLYLSHLIKSLNCMNFVFHFMSLIELTKYESSLFSTIMSCDDDTCLLIESFFESCNR